MQPQGGAPAQAPSYDELMAFYRAYQQGQLPGQQQYQPPQNPGQYQPPQSQ